MEVLKIDGAQRVEWERILRRILAAAADCQDFNELVRQTISSLREALQAETLKILRSRDDRAELIAVAGSESEGDERTATERLLTLDAGEQLRLAAQFAGSDADAANEELLAEAADTLGAAWRIVTHRRRLQEDLRRKETLLQITNRWYQARQLRPLLVEITRAVAEFVDADRATIFLWDREAKQLVGRPALGVDDELRIPDDRGIAGRVLREHRPIRVDRDSPAQAWIDQQVGTHLGYRTETLLCVPLLDRAGKSLGVFQVINKHKGNFTGEDEEALARFADQAAAALESVRDYEELLTARRRIVDQAAEGVRLIGRSPVVEELRALIEKLAATDLTVLILGEHGTGKEVAAHMIHYLSARREHPFVAVNCAAIPEALAESELFGHEKGAFTDARQAKPGKFEVAAGGTIFLDEIGELSLPAQAKLLRVLEERTITRVGGTQPIPVRARLLAATNQDLERMIQEKRFREDLFFRLNGVTLRIPPLRERGDDILMLAEHFLTEFAARARRPVPKLTPTAKARLMQHTWPGNIRELRNMMERAAYLCSQSILDADDLGLDSKAVAGPPRVAPHLPLSEATRQFQSEYILQTIAFTNRNLAQAAQRLGLHRANLYRKIRQLGLKIPRDEPTPETP
ncbi:sigma-54-dependent Fis family transcriptional regulator [Thermopirellula anaerolimosa]